MFICVNNILKGDSERINFSEEVLLPQIEAINPLPRVDVDGTITNDNGKYNFYAKVKAYLEFSCSSCLEPVLKQIDFEVFEVYAKGEGFSDDEIIFFSSKDNIIDFTDAMRTNLILNLPMKVVCSEDCSGMCSVCGQNLNKKDCDCEKEYINPKFEKILKLFNEKKEG